MGYIIMTQIWEYVGTTSIGIIIAGVGFWLTVGKNLLSKEEIIKLIETQSPYVNDKQYIMEKLNTHKETQIQFASALQRNTEVMMELKTQLAVLSKTLESIENRIESQT